MMPSGTDLVIMIVIEFFLKTFEKIIGKFVGVVVPRVSAVHTDDQCWIKSWALGAAAQGI